MLLAFLQGVSFATAPILSVGPFKVFVISSAIKNGWLKSISLAFVPLVADIPVIVLLWFALGRLPSTILTFLRLAGGVFYLYLAYNLYRNAGRPVKAGSSDQAQWRTFWQAVTAVWITPQVYINWSIIGIPALIAYADQSAAHAIVFLLGFYGLWVPGLAAQIFVAGQAGRIGAKAPRYLLYAGCVLLIAFGVLQIWEGITEIL